jgi:hypothetical protein
MMITIAIGIAAILLFVVAPLLLALSRLFFSARESTGLRATSIASWNWTRIVVSALLYTLAFNLTFFIQELFLVLPKALTPGLLPTLYHNNHNWKGENPLASLFQGTGALATFHAAIACVLWLRSRRDGSTTVRLFVIWMAYCGFFMALPQVAIGAISHQSDLGMAMDYLELGTTTRVLVALIALAAIPPIALWLKDSLLGLCSSADHLASPGKRIRLIFQIATLPSLIALPMIIPFRVPREWVEVAVLPLLVTLIGIGWIQAGAWLNTDAKPGGGRGVESMAWPLVAVMLLFLVFQFLLRPGVPFY